MWTKNICVRHCKKLEESETGMVSPLNAIINTDVHVTVLHACVKYKIQSTIADHEGETED